MCNFDNSHRVTAMRDGDVASGVCQHKDLWPMFQLEMWGMLAVALMLFYTNLGGLAGGGIHLPLCMGFFKLSTKQSVALTNASICLSAVARIFWNARQSHPLKNGKGLMIDTGIALLMMPMVISGVSFGVILNVVMPDGVSAIVFTVIVLYVSIGVAKKGCKIYR